MNSIETIREAWRRYHAIATNQPDREPLMSIPVNRERDADCILVDAIDELARLRIEVDRLRHVLDQATEIAATREAELNEARRQRDHQYAVCENAKAAARKLGEELSAVRARLESPKHALDCRIDRISHIGCTCGVNPPVDRASLLPRDPDPAWMGVPAELVDASTIRIGDRYLGPAIGRWITALGPWSPADGAGPRWVKRARP